MNHNYHYPLTCENCGHEWKHSADDAPGAVFIVPCPDCGTIKTFWDAAEPKGHAKSRELEKEIAEVFLEQTPRLTVRQVYYALTVRHAIPKTQAGYRQTCYALKNMRLRGQLPYGWIADNTRWQIRPKTYSGLEAALFNMQQLYRRNLWETSRVNVEIWVEKDALAGVISPVTNEYDVPLFVARGYSSMTFIYDAAEQIKESGKPTHIYHFGDFDPSGVDAAYKIRDELKGHGANIHFYRAAVTDEQITRYSLPTRETKTKDTRAAKWGDRPSVELDALPAKVLRDLVRECIEMHIDPYELARLRTVEEQERGTLATIRENFGTGTKK